MIEHVYKDIPVSQLDTQDIFTRGDRVIGMDIKSGSQLLEGFLYDYDEDTGRLSEIFILPHLDLKFAVSYPLIPYPTHNGRLGTIAVAGIYRWSSELKAWMLPSLFIGPVEQTVPNTLIAYIPPEPTDDVIFDPVAQPDYDMFPGYYAPGRGLMRFPAVHGSYALPLRYNLETNRNQKADWRPFVVNDDGKIIHRDWETLPFIPVGLPIATTLDRPGSHL